jgi:beta-1,4-mannosyl-glycoprotein beta-1,4-N-acetylglucosaminyltransferase
MCVFAGEKVILWWLKRNFTLLSYYTRPMWDSTRIKEYDRWNIIPFLGVESGNLSCQYHNFTKRQNSTIKVFSAFTMNTELDILEIRLNELDSIVDKFIIYESSCAFMGQHKGLMYEQHKQRFASFHHKIIHVKRNISQNECILEPTSWNAETFAREQLIKAARSIGGAKDGDLFHMSDVDEIPHLETLQLLKQCDFGDRIHLALPTYRYSFEFRVWPEFVFRSTVSVIGTSRIPDDKITARSTYYTNTLLGGAGWHCSYCIRNLSYIVDKMNGFSHNDRVGFDPHCRKHSVLQQRICKGEDPFGYPPEAYDFYSMASMVNLAPITGSQHVPSYVRKNMENFRYLLPGGCRMRG